MKSLIYQSITRRQNSDRICAHTFEDAAGRKLSDHCSAGTVKESRRFGVRSRNIAVLARSENVRTSREVRSWPPDPIRILLVTGALAFIGVTLVILIQDIHPAPDKHTLEKDAAELASLDTQSHMGHSYIEAQSLSLTRASSAGIDRVDAPPEELSQPELAKSRLTASMASPVDRKKDTDSREVMKQSRAFKRDLKGRADNIRNPQRQTALAATRQQPNQSGLISLFSAIGRALHLSSN